MTKSAWGANSWARDSENAEAGRNQNPNAPDEVAFPSLQIGAAAGSRRRKNRGQTLSLLELHTGTATGTGTINAAVEDIRLTLDERRILPTGPAELADDLPLRNGGRNFGEGAKPRGWGSSRGYEEKIQHVSRADAVDDWRAAKRSVILPLPRPVSAGRADIGNWNAVKRSVTFPPPRPASAGCADEVENWNAAKRPIMFPPPRPCPASVRRADAVDDWRAGKRSVMMPPPRPASSRRVYNLDSLNDTKSSVILPDSRPSSSGCADDVEVWNAAKIASLPPSDRQRLVLDPPIAIGGDDKRSDVHPVAKPSLFGGGRPREEVLDERGVNWRKRDQELERPNSDVSRTRSSEDVAPPLSKRSNPFGGAKPREEVLTKKGIDWRMADLQLDARAIGRTETPEEEELKKEINSLKKKLEEYTKSQDKSSNKITCTKEEQTAVEGKIKLKEDEFRVLIAKLNDEAMFKKMLDDSRPGSSSRYSYANNERPPGDGNRSSKERR